MAIGDGPNWFVDRFGETRETPNPPLRLPLSALAEEAEDVILQLAEDSPDAESDPGPGPECVFWQELAALVVDLDTRSLDTRVLLSLHDMVHALLAWRSSEG